jgi:DNA-binding NtrC family response regulator
MTKYVELYAMPELGKALKGIQILIIEDDNVLRTTTSIFLLERGASVLEASNGSSGLHLFSSNSDLIDLVFSDIRLPLLNGIDLYRHVQTITPGKKFVFTSGFEVPSDMRSLVPDELFIPKPFRGHDLIVKLCEVLKNDFLDLVKSETNQNFNFLRPSNPSLKAERQ